MTSLAEALRKWRDDITKYLYVGCAHWDDLTDRVEREERRASDCLADEQVWTFLVACGYAAAGEDGVSALAEHLTGSRQKHATCPRIWFEVVPLPPRKKEGGTHVDLALGTIARREGTDSGIQLDDVESPWICFCEMKWYSDISVRVTYDAHRNQLARLIENAVCFQAAGKYAERVYVTLVTPSIFRRARAKSRLYQYKFEEYEADRSCLLRDLNECGLEATKRAGWTHPFDLSGRVRRDLSLRWATYDDLFKNLPHSAIAGVLGTFWRQRGGPQGPHPIQA